jgi:hypothetical protein
MTVPHRDDVACVATLRPDHHHQPAVEMTRGDETRLAIIEPIVDDRCGTAIEYLVGSREIQPAMPPRQVRFAGSKVISMNLLYPQ